MTRELLAEITKHVQAAEKELRIARSLTPCESDIWSDVRQDHASVHALEHFLKNYKLSTH